MVQVLSGLWGPWPPGGQEWGGAGALPPSEPQMVLLILSLIALTARMSCKQRSADSKNHTIFKWRWFATVEHNQKNALQALKGIPKYKCSQHSICPTSAVKSHCSPGKRVLAVQFCKWENRYCTPQVTQWVDAPGRENFVLYCLEFRLLGPPPHPAWVSKDNFPAPPPRLSKGGR